MPKIDSDRTATYILLAVVIVFSFFRFTSLGYHNDDYPILGWLHSSPSKDLLSVTAHIWDLHPGRWTRFVDIPYFSIPLVIFGTDSPLPFHFMLRLFEFLAALGLYALLRGEKLAIRTALLASTIAILYPNHDATRNWLTCGSATLVMAMTLWSMFLYRFWLRKKRPAALATSLLLMALSILTYEVAVFVPISLLLMGWKKRTLKGATSSLRECAPIAGTWFLVVFYQRVIVPTFLLAEMRHPLAFSPKHFLDVTLAGLECTLANRLTHRIAKACSFAIDQFSTGEWILYAACAAGLCILYRELTARDCEPAPRWLMELGLLIIFFGYLPYFFDTTYTPSMFNQNNRTNAVPSFGGGMVLTWLLLKLNTKNNKASLAIGGLLLSGFLIGNWASNGEWSEAYRIQGEIVTGIEKHIAGKPHPKTLLLFGSREKIGSAVVFESTYDLDYRLRTKHKDPNFSATMGQGRTHFTKEHVAFSWTIDTSKISYDGLYAYHHAKNHFARIENLAAANAFLKETQ